MTRLYLGDTSIILQGGDEPFVYDSAGCRWQWGGTKLWSSSPAPKAVTGDNANDHGSWDATEFYAARRYPLEGLVYAPDHDSLHAAENRFNTACGLGFRLRCVEPGFDRGGWFRRDGETSWTELTQRIARFSVPLWAGDPRGYSTVPKTGSTGFPSSIGGLSWPARWPARWDAVVSSGQMRLVNAGNDIAWPVWRIDGPVVNPSIVNADNGAAMNFDITLGAGEWLTVDTSSHEVLGNGEVAASRRTTFYGDWWGLAAGATNVRFLGQSGGSGASLSYAYYDTSI